MTDNSHDQINCSHCDYLKFAIIVLYTMYELMVSFKLNDIEDIKREVEKYND